MKKTAHICMILLVVLALACPALAADKTDLTIRPNLVNIGTGFNGTTLSITGKVPEGCSAVIRVLGQPEDKTFKQKGRVMGVLWMNLNSVVIKGVPDVFLMGTDGASHTDWEHSDLAFQAVKGDTDDKIFDEFIKLMEKDDFYEVENGVVKYGTAKDGVLPFTSELAIPSAMRAGVYRVEVLAVKDGKIVDEASEELHTRLAGLPAFLSKLAFEHSLLYGISAVVIALLVGLLMSVIFRERGGAH